MVLMTSRILPSSPVLAFQMAATTNAMASPWCCWCSLAEVRTAARADRVAQDADAVGFHLDDVAGVQPAVQLQTGRGGRRAGPQNLPGAQGQVLGGVGDHRGERMMHV